jgi:pimeloyl-ACP methyl ester carboxylesterase
MTRVCGMLVGLWACVAGVGCFAPEPPGREQSDRGLVILLPGIESGAWQLEGSIRGLRQAGVDRAIEVIEWGRRPLASMDNLTNLPANLERAKKIAGRVVSYEQEHPQRPVVVVGYSGGGGLAVLTAEALPEGCRIERMILIAAALAPDHDLSKTLSHCRDGLVNFYSERDVVMLGAGTALFGTIDRKYTPAAGRLGFRDTQGKLLADKRVTQIAWESGWLWLGHNGMHTGWLAPGWSRDVLAARIDPTLGGRPTDGR